MTVSSIVPVNNHTGNSSTKIFDFDFLIENESELVVQHIDSSGIVSILEKGVDYSIAEIGNKNGSNITFPLSTSKYNILGKEEYLSLSLDLQIKQESEFHNSSYFNLEILEWTFDYIVRILQILNRKVERCIKVEETAEVKPEELIADLYDTRKEVQSSYLEVVKLSNDAKINSDIAVEKSVLAAEQLEQVKNEVEKAKFQADIAAQKARDALGVPIGTLISQVCDDVYVPEGYLPCDGAEYTKEQFNEFCENYLKDNISSIIENDWVVTTTQYGHKTWNGFAYGNGVYIVVGNDGYMSKSTDGFSWSNPKVPATTGNKSAVAFGKGVFVASANGSNYFMRTTNNGESWNNTVVSTNTNWLDIKYGNDAFVSISNSKIATSTDLGITWTEQDTIDASYLSFGNGKFIIINSSGDVSTSTDALTWTDYVQVLQPIKALAYDEKNKIFVANTTSGIVMSSADGLMWKRKGIIPTNTYSKFAIGAGKAIILDNTTNTAYETLDYKNWTSTKLYDSTSAYYWCLGYGGDKFFALRGGSSDVNYKICYIESKALLSICSYDEYEAELEANGQCTKFAVSKDDTVRSGILKGDFSFDLNFVLLANNNPDGVDWVFVYDGANWKLNETIVNLDDYYVISITGDLNRGDSFYIRYLPNSIKTFRVPLIKNTETDVTNNIDYANKLELESTPVEATPFVAPYDGVLIFTIAQNLNEYRYCYINGVKVPFQYFDGEGITNADAYFIPLSKNDSLYWTSAITLKDGGFYPYKEKTKEKLKSFVVVANGQTNQSLMDWSAWASSLQRKLNADHSNDTKPYIIEVSDKTILPSWYRVWSDGWCEQGGAYTGNATLNVTLLKPYINTAYNIIISGSAKITAHTTLGFTTDSNWGNSTKSDGYWQAKGYIK